MKTERFEYWDSLRGIACLIVVFFHTLLILCPELSYQNIIDSHLKIFKF